MTRDLLASLDRGHNVVVEAAPGTGKTRLLTTVCRQTPSSLPCLLLAYNAELAAATRPLLPDHADCMTFHALCARCLAPTRDDHDMLDAVTKAEAGQLCPRNVPVVRRVLIDEAQDVRPLYVRLLRACGLLRDDVRLVVVGDRNQLIYDFDEEFPASLATLCETETVFFDQTPWRRSRLDTSYRVSQPMATLVNHMFGSSIVSANPTHGDATVDVRSPRSMFKLATLLEDVVREERSILLLVSHKKNNAALKTLLNDWSRGGVRVRVHGMHDPLDEEEEGVCCGTFWSAKGLTHEAVVVLLPDRAAPNPTYVALTRSCRRLVVVLDPKAPHAAFCHAVHRHPEAVEIHDEWTAKALQLGCTEDPDESLQKRTWSSTRNDTSLGRNMDFHLPPRADVVSGCTVTYDDADDEEFVPPDASQWKTEVAVRMVLVLAECKATGRVRHVEDIFSPTRLDNEQDAEAIRHGLVSRWIRRHVPDDALLAHDLRTATSAAYDRLKTSADTADVTDVVLLSLSILAWDDFDHLMRGRLPVHASTYAPLARHVLWGVRTLRSHEAYSYDTRLVDGSTHCRVHANDPASHCVLVEWERTTAGDAAAAVRAGMHPKGVCRVLELARGVVRTVTAHSRFHG